MNINLNSINKDSIKELQKQFNNLTETSKKYANMGYEKTTHIIFREPADEIEESFVKKVNIKNFILLMIITAVFLVTFILSFVTGAKIIVKVISGIIILISGYFTYKAISTKELMIGKAVYKERKRSTSGKSRSYTYFVSVADEENKLIYTRIQISKNDYELIEEGTPILISKGSGKGYIYEK